MRTRFDAGGDDEGGDDEGRSSTRLPFLGAPLLCSWWPALGTAPSSAASTAVLLEEGPTTAGADGTRGALEAAGPLVAARNSLGTHLTDCGRSVPRATNSLTEDRSDSSQWLGTGSCPAVVCGSAADSARR